MQILWLKAFTEVVKYENFSDAADALYVSQSSLSKYIQMIENILGVALLDRTRRKVKLTVAGEQFINYAQEIVDKYDEMLKKMEQYTDKSSKRIRIVTVAAPNIYGYTNLFYEFSRAHAEIDFSLKEIDMSEALSRLKNKEADFAVVRTNLITDIGAYQELRLNTEGMYLLCSKRHPFSRKKEVSLEEILQEKLILTKFAEDEIRYLFRKYRLNDKMMKINLTSTNNSILREFVENDLGVSICSNELANLIDPYGRLLMIPIKEKPEMTLGMLYQKNELNKACYDFLVYMEEKMKEKKKFFEGPCNPYEY